MPRFGRISGLILGLVVAPGLAAMGHPMPGSAVVLRLHRAEVSVELTLPIAELATGWDQPLPTDAGPLVGEFGERLKAYLRSHVRATSPEGRSWNVTVLGFPPVDPRSGDVRVALSMTPPPGAPVDRFWFHYDVIFHRLVTHSAVVTLAADWKNGVMGDEPLVLGTMRDTSPDLAIDRDGGSWARGFAAMFRLGARHIAEGTDHLLFLLALILPAPLVAGGGTWGGFAGTRTAIVRVVKLATAFTIGHSITLAIGAVGGVNLPAAVVESAIALSILVAAAHALVPIFRGGEIYIAGGFGLVHGLAFASTLTGFGFDPWTLVSSLLGFNLGIEAFQVLIILLIMPCLVTLAPTRLYGPIRVAGATGTVVAATAWLAERAGGTSNSIQPIVEKATEQAPWLYAILVALAVVTAIHQRSRTAASRRTEIDHWQ